MKKTIIYKSKKYEGQVCSCHGTAIWPSSAYDAHLERTRLIQNGEYDPYKIAPWRRRKNDTVNREKKRKQDLASGKERLIEEGLADAI